MKTTFQITNTQKEVINRHFSFLMSRGFKGSVNISESCDFKSQFYPLFRILFVGIYVFNEKILNKHISKFKDD